MAPITPGLLTADDAASLNEARERTDADRRTLDGMTGGPAGDFPAKITSFDSVTQTFAWVEQWYDANGQRADRPGGRFGSASWDPAKPVGNGLLPPPVLPVEVRLTPTVATADRGLVYEFPWSCNCAGQGSGTGSGGTSGTGVLTSCCPNAIPTTLTVTLAQTSGAACALDGSSVTVTSIGSGAWAGSVTAAGHTWAVQVVCSSSVWSVYFTSAGCDFDCIGLSTVSCNPLHLTGTTTATPGGCASCASAAFDVDVTE